MCSNVELENLFFASYDYTRDDFKDANIHIFFNTNAFF